MKLKVIFKILIISLVAIMLLNTVVFAASDTPSDESTSYTSPTQFDELKAEDDHTVSKLIIKTFSIALNLLRIVALGWAVIMLIFIAMKYMISTPDIRGQLKTDMPTYALGALLLFGASGLLQIVTYFVNDVFN